MIDNELRESAWNARSASETIEHVYPKNPDSKVWKGVMEKYERNEKHIDRLGNLLLLPPGLNSEAGNRDFKTKKGIYKRTEGLRMVADALRAREWNQKVIDKRECERKLKDSMIMI